MSEEEAVRAPTRRRFESGTTSECSQTLSFIAPSVWSGESGESDIELDDSEDPAISRLGRRQVEYLEDTVEGSNTHVNQEGLRFLDDDPVLPRSQPPIVHATATADAVFISPQSADLLLGLERVPSARSAAPVSRHLRKLVAHVLMFTQRPFDFLQRKIDYHKRKLVKATLSVTFHSSSPLSILLHRPAIAVCFLLVATLQFYFAISDIVERGDRTITGRAFRFTPVQLKSGTTDIAQPHIQNFVVAQEVGSCLNELLPDHTYVEGKHFVAEFEEDTRMDGFLMITGGPVDSDPVRFEVSVQKGEKEEEGEGRWEHVAFQRNLLRVSGTYTEGRSIAPPQHRGQVVAVDLRASSEWQWYLARGGGGLGMAVGLLIGGVSGLLGMVRAGGRQGLYGSWALASLSMLVAGCIWMQAGVVEEGAMWVWYGVMVGGATGTLWYRERHLRAVLLALGSGLLLSDLVCHGALVGTGWQDVTVTPGHGVLGACMLTAGVLFWMLSLSQHRAVNMLLAPDQATYAEAWREMCAREGVEQQLGQLQRVVASANVEDGGHVHQCQRIVVSAGKGVGMDGNEKGSVWMRAWWWARNTVSTVFYDMPHDHVNLVRMHNLDQIYAQATSVHPLLKSKVKEWAHTTGGMFPTADGGGYVRWEARGSAERRTIHWGRLKTEERAIEKAIRCYGEDVSRLCDVCRQSIVFETVGELANCLKEMVGDPGVELVRIKNRLRQEEDGAWSAGFRNVSVNLRITDEDARSFGVDTHVCEVQLLTKDFAKLQGEEMRHKRYLLHRDFHRPVHHSSLSTPCAGWVLEKLAGLWTEGDQDVARMLLLRTGSRRTSSDGGTSRAGGIPAWLLRRESSTGSASGQGPRTGRRRSSMAILLKSSFLDPISNSSRHWGSWGGSGNGSGNNRIFKRFSLARLSQHTFRHRAERTTSVWRDDVLQAYLRLIFRRNTSSKGKRGHLLDFWKAMEAVSPSSVLFIRHPIQGALSKRVWRLFGLMVASVVLIFSLSILVGYVSTTWHSQTIIRFTAVGNSTFPDGPALTPGIHALVPRANGCPLLTRPYQIDTDGPSLTQHYEEPLRMDWFSFTTSFASDSQAADPLRFKLEGSNNNQDWSLIGGSHFYSDFWRGVQWSDGYLEGVTGERGAEHVLGGNFGFVRLLDMLAWQAPVPAYVGLLVAIIRADAGNLESVRILAGGCLSGFAAMMVLAGVRWNQDAWFAQQNMCLAGIFLIIGITIVVRQQFIFIGGCVSMVWGLVARQVHATINGWQGLLVDQITYILGGILGVGVLAGLIRLHILAASRRMVDQDKKKYDAIWASVCETEKVALERLQEISDAQRMRAEAVPRHTYSPAIIHDRSTHGHGHGLERASSGSKAVPIMDIDQIYAQAMCLHPILLGKVKEWALKAGGMFAIEGGGFVRWEEARDSPEKQRTIKWGQLKKEGRAIEKVIRCYGEDVSRLVDLCRQNIVFATVDDLANCLKEMVGDPGVELVRVKNRMELEEDGAWSAGFRNVSVNLRITDEDARSFGVDTHVCEVQLLTKDFAKLQKAQGHKRYVHFRNVRGE